MMKDMVNNQLDSDPEEKVEETGRGKMEQAKVVKERAKILKSVAKETDVKCSEDFRERMMQKADNMRQRHKKEL